jgi:hypothetical protein
MRAGLFTLVIGGISVGEGNDLFHNLSAVMSVKPTWAHTATQLCPYQIIV